MQAFSDESRKQWVETMEGKEPVSMSFEPVGHTDVVVLSYTDIRNNEEARQPQ